MKRREFITLLGGAAAAWPMVADAQTATPVIGFLDSRSPDALADRLRGFRLGLKLAGYAEGENVAVVYRFAENQAEAIPKPTFPERWGIHIDDSAVGDATQRVDIPEPSLL